jgi:glutamine amidotransferase
MGWNSVSKTVEIPLLHEFPEGAYCYLVHSYAAPVTTATVATCEYGWPFAAVVQQGNFLATQFHPERSGTAGSTILRNFLTRY